MRSFFFTNSSYICLLSMFVIAGCDMPPEQANTEANSTSSAPSATNTTTAEDSTQSATTPGSAGFSDLNQSSVGNLFHQFDEMSINNAIQTQLRISERTLDLTFLSKHGDIVTKADLQPLAAPECKRFTKLLLRGVRLSKGALAPATNVPVEVLDLSESSGDIQPVQKMHKLLVLYLTGMTLAPNDVRMLGRMRQLRNLILEKTNISDKELPYLYGLKNIVGIVLNSCPNVTVGGVENLRRKLPKADIEYTMHATARWVDTQTGHELEELVDAGKYKEAEATIRQSIEQEKKSQHPNYQRIGFAYVLLAKSLAGQDAHKNGPYAVMAQKMFDTAIESDKAHDCIAALQLVYLEYANFLESYSRVEDAIDVRTKCEVVSKENASHTMALEWRTRRAENLTSLGNDCAFDHQYDRAGTAFQQAAEIYLTARHEDAWMAIRDLVSAGKRFKQGGNIKLSNAAFQRAKELLDRVSKDTAATASREIRLVYADAFLNLGNLPQAEKRFNNILASVASKPVAWRARLGLAEVAERKNELDEAIANAKSSLELADQGKLGTECKAESLLAIARITKKQGNYIKARVTVAELLKLLEKVPMHSEMKEEAAALQKELFALTQKK